jgi:hypothetical protein
MEVASKDRFTERRIHSHRWEKTGVKKFKAPIPCQRCNLRPMLGMQGEG